MTDFQLSIFRHKLCCMRYFSQYLHKVMKYILAIFVLSICSTFADRLVNQSLSDKEPGTPDYDHDAFVGKEEARKFDQLSPEESRRRLGIIVDKIDTDGDGMVSEKELNNWITFTRTRHIRDDSIKQLKTHDKDEDGRIHWDEYKENTYGFLGEDDLSHDFNYKKMLARDQRRWNKADLNGDGYCTDEEFQAFLHPEQFDHMKGIVTKETLDDIDKNSDGYVDIEEYIADMFDQDDGQEPEWISAERRQFSFYRDKNKDGKLDESEIRAWILPDDYDHADAEAKHLIYDADDNKDGMLSKGEIITHHDKFVGSQATDWGEALNRHEEF